VIGEEAGAKAERQAHALIARARTLLRGRNLPDFTQTAVSVIGEEASFGAHARIRGSREVVARISVDHPSMEGAGLFAREQASGISTMAVGTSINLATAVQPLTGLFGCLVPREASPATVHFAGEARAVPATPGRVTAPAVSPPPPPPESASTVPVELIRLAWGRSGDKGSLFNLAVIARDPAYFPWLAAAMTPAAVADWYAHLGRDGAPPEVQRYVVPGFHALNFVVRDSLDGGITRGARLDPAAKGMAQMIMRFLVRAARAGGRTQLIVPRTRRRCSMNDYSYLMKGIVPLSTDSSTLVSSSKYLNEPRLRDWVATHMLRRNGADVPTPSDSIQLVMILREVQDADRINALFAEERRVNPALDAWFKAGFSSHFSRDDLAGYAPETVGGIFYRQLVDNDLQVDIVPPFTPRNDYEYFLLRSGQTHDLEHILGGGGFDFIGELVPYYMRLTNVFVHLGAELAGELSTFSILGSTRIMTRAVLHYPSTWLTVLDAIERGAKVGRESRPLYMMKYEDVFAMTPEQARRHLGIEGVREADTATAPALWA
jgi:ubiquinone biosynthesis protein COQ4